ncbi:MAG TPA: hypothetical protein VF658_18325 [Pyrinomonadaceae bacterium]
MKSLALFLIACVVVLPCAFAQQAPVRGQRNASAGESAKYIGLRHGPSLPAGLQEVGGSLVSDVGDVKEYGMSEVHKGKVKMLWFERLTHRDDSGAAYWEVKDVLVLPKILRKQILVYSLCFLAQKPDGEIAAIADEEFEAEFFTRIRRAWRANRKTEKFEEISVKGIKCRNEGYGV